MNKKGFTLIEMAIVLIVIGILLSTSIGLFTSTIKATKMRDQAVENKKVASSILTYAKANGLLPDYDNFSKVISSKKDIFGQDYKYSYASTLDKENICQNIHDNAKYRIIICKDIDCNDFTTLEDMAFAISSNGLNRMPDYKEQELIRTYYVGVEGKDDILEYYTLAELRAAIDCSSYEIKNALRFENTEIPPIRKENASNNNSLVIYAGGGTPYNNGYKWEISNFADDQGGYTKSYIKFDDRTLSSSLTTTGEKLTITFDNAIDNASSTMRMTFNIRVSDKNNEKIEKMFVLYLY